MALVEQIDFREGSVRVKFHRSEERPYTIYKALLSKHAPLLELRLALSGWVTDVDVEPKIFGWFVHWIHHRQAPYIDDDGLDYFGDTLSALLTAHAFGIAVGGIDFADMILDVTMDFLSDPDLAPRSFFVDVVDALAAEFEVGSRGREFALDYLVYINDFAFEDSISIYQCVQEAGDPGFITELARRIMQAKGVAVPEDISQTHFDKMVVCGHIMARDCGDRIGVAVYPWKEDRCRYHRHTELGLPCYKGKP